MKHVIRIGIAAAACVAVSLAAQAADLRRAPPGYVVPPPVAVWSGCYFGLNIGGGWAQATVSDPTTGIGLGTVSPAGFVGGGQVGCDYQMGQFVIGVQGMADAADIKGSRLQPNGIVTSNFNVPWFETLTARFGFAVLPTTLLYVKGGAAWVRDNFWTSAGGTTIGNGIITPTGWTVGAGAEFLFYSNWSVFAEYNYLGFGNNQIALIPNAGAVIPVNLNHNVQTILVGVNYRFGTPFRPGY
jgi:outer membrane immunogenic protein